MLRYNILMIALGCVAVTVVMSRQGADAQSGQSIAFAEHACLDYEVPPGTTAFESCVERASRAFDRGEPDLAYMHARLTREAGAACLSYGVEFETAGYRQCVATRIDRRTRH